MNTQTFRTVRFFDLLNTYNEARITHAVKSQEYKERFEPLWKDYGFIPSLCTTEERALAAEIDQAMVVIGFNYSKLKAHYSEELTSYLTALN